MALRVAIIGWGRFGEYLGGLIASDVDSLEVTAIVEPDPTRRARARRVQARTYESVEQLLINDPDVLDAAIITSPNVSHCEQAVALATNGKHIFCEKPMAVDSAECVRMIKAAVDNDICLMVGHKRRLRPAWSRLRELCSTGALGAIRAVNVEGWHYHPDVPDWWLRQAEGGGLLHRAGVHDLDYCNAVLGGPEWVEAVDVSTPIGADFPNVMWLRIGYADAVAGVSVALGFSPIHFRASFSVSVMGTDGSAKLSPSPGAGQELIWGADHARLTKETFGDGYEDAYCAELRSFASWVSTGTEPILSWREGWQAVRVMEAAYEAARAGRRISLPTAPDVLPMAR